MLPYVIGIVLGVFVALLTRGAGFDRDRSLYPTMLIVIAWYYVLFAVMGGSTRAIVAESGVMVLFTLVAVFGFWKNLWWVAAGIAGHGLFDFVHGRFIENPGLPAWWPAFCGTIDVALAAWFAALLTRGRVSVR